MPYGTLMLATTLALLWLTGCIGTRFEQFNQPPGIDWCKAVNRKDC